MSFVIELIYWTMLTALAILDSWAEARLAKEKAIAEAEAKAAAKADLLNRLA